MWLRILTTGLILFGLALLFLNGLIVGKRPAPDDPKAIKIAYLRRSAVYIGIEAATLIGAIVGAYMIGRRARDEFRRQSEQNFKDLLEGALQDHKKPDEGA